MKGAMGYMRGFIWPHGGGPHVSHSELQVPFCVIVEFDDVNLGGEEYVDENGKPAKPSRSFFPDLDLGLDSEGKPRSGKCVPIFRDQVSSMPDENVSRHQFPLTLAWALTHWKAQGMTLRRVRIHIGSRTAGVAGIGFVAATRVKQPTRLVFEEDLPPWEDFHCAQSKEGFSSRMRFELRLGANASRTFRKFRCCAADPWEEAGVKIAGEIIGKLQDETIKSRSALRCEGDPDAYLWPVESILFDKFMAEAVRDIAGTDSVLLARAELVAERLLGPLHMPAVLEALGCLIPVELHPVHNGKKPGKGQPGREVPEMGVNLMAGTWGISVFEEQMMGEGRLSKGALEFFLIVLRHVCGILQLPWVLGSHKMGLHVHTASSVARLRLIVRTWKSRLALEGDLADAQRFIVPVRIEDGKVCKDCVFLAVESQVPKQALPSASRLMVRLWDPVRRTRLADSLAQKVVRLVRGSAAEDVMGIQMSIQEYAFEGSSTDRCVLGMIVAELNAFADLEGSGPEDPQLLRDIRRNAQEVFAHLRVQGDERSAWGVLQQLADRDSCEKLLKLFARRGALEPSPCARQAEVPLVHTHAVPIEEFDPVRVLTWNIDGAGLPGVAPQSFTIEERLAALQSEVRRLGADVVSTGVPVQSQEPLALLNDLYAFAGAAQAHSGFVHLYVRKNCIVRRKPLGFEAPCVMAEMRLGKDIRADVVGVHLPAGSVAAMPVYRSCVECRKTVWVIRCCFSGILMCDSVLL